MYWHNENLPDFSVACIRSVRRHNPKLKITILSQKDIPLQFQNMQLTHKQEANIVRLFFVSQYGGIWLDVHCICTSELPFNLMSSHLQVYSSFDGCIDNWAFASPAKDEVLCAWYEEYSYALKCGLDVYCAKACKHFKIEKELKDRLPYLACYIASAYAQEKTNWVSKKNAHAHMEPFYYLEKRNYMRELMYGTTDAPLVKLTEPISSRVAHALEVGKYEPNASIPRELLSSA